MPNHFRKKNLTLILLLIIVFLGASLRFYQLNQESLWTDEMITLNHLKNNDISSVIESVKQAELMPAGYFILLFYWIKAFGSSEFSLRILPAIFDIFSTILVYGLSKKLFNSKVGILSALIYATTMVNLVYAQEARPYSCFGFLSLLSTYLWVRIFQQTKFNLKTTIGYIIITTLALYVNYMALVLMAFHLMPAIVLRWKKLIKIYLISAGMILALFLPGITILLQQAALRQVTLQENLGLRSVPSFLSSLGIGFYLIPAVLLITITVIALIKLKKKTPLPEKNSTMLVIITIIIFMALTTIYLETVMRSFALIRHSLFLAPVFYILASRTILRIKPRGYLLPVILVILLFNAGTLAIYYSQTTKAPWREMVSFIEDNSVGAPIILFDRTGSNVDLFHYYQHQSAQAVKLTEMLDGKLVEIPISKIAKVLESKKEFWFVSSRNIKSKTPYPEILNKRYQLVLKLTSTEITVIKFKT